MRPKKFSNVPNALNEEFYQITTDILTSFNKFRPPLNIYEFREDVSRVVPYYKVGERLSKERIEELAGLTNDGFAFVSRDDHSIYAKHIAHQIDLVLVDKHLKEKEIVECFMEALTMRMEQFLDQPVVAVWEKLRRDILVLTEYLWQDPFRIKALCKRLFPVHTLPNHSVNTGLVGLAMFMRMYAEGFKKGEIKRDTFNRVACGLFIHDVGMIRVPAFIRDKAKPLTPDERGKVNAHTGHGFQMLAKLDLKFPEVEKCVSEHHERMTGSGYPQKLANKSISLLGRVCGLSDSFSAMITKRPFAEAMEPAEAVRLLVADKGYDPKLAMVLQAIVLTDGVKTTAA